MGGPANHHRDRLDTVEIAETLSGALKNRQENVKKELNVESYQNWRRVDFRVHHHHLPVTYVVGVQTDLHKLLHSWQFWAEERRECKSIWVHSLMLDNQDFLGLPLFLPSNI